MCRLLPHRDEGETGPVVLYTYAQILPHVMASIAEPDYTHIVNLLTPADLRSQLPNGSASPPTCVSHMLSLLLQGRRLHGNGKSVGHAPTSRDRHGHLCIQVELVSDKKETVHIRMQIASLS